MLSPILNYLSPLKSQGLDSAARKWLMLWRLRGSQCEISWDSFVRMPEEAFDYFPALRSESLLRDEGPGRCTSVRACTDSGVTVEVVRWRWPCQGRYRRFFDYAAPLLDGVFCRRLVTRLYRITARKPIKSVGTRAGAHILSCGWEVHENAEGFHEAMLCAIRLCEGPVTGGSRDT